MEAIEGGIHASQEVCTLAVGHIRERTGGSLLEIGGGRSLRDLHPAEIDRRARGAIQTLENRECVHAELEHDGAGSTVHDRSIIVQQLLDPRHRREDLLFGRHIQRPEPGTCFTSIQAAQIRRPIPNVRLS